MNTRPTPMKIDVERKSDGLALVNLTFKNADAEACRRCDLCRAKPGPAKGRATCTVEMPAAAVEGFVWGSASRLDRATAAAPSAGAEATGPAKPRKPRRRRRKSIDDIAADQVASMAEERAFDAIREDDDDACDRRAARTQDATDRLERAVLEVHADFDTGGTKVVAVETEHFIIAKVPAYAVIFTDNGDGVTIAIPKGNVVKLTEVEAE